VILAASDMDRGLFGSYLLDGQLKIMKSMQLYTSSKDNILKGSKAIHYSPRMGQTIGAEEMSDSTREFLQLHQEIRLVDVSQAEEVSTHGGHFYFLESPWVSSDMLLTLLMEMG
jgi:esterase/lipase superfamily enzyme